MATTDVLPQLRCNICGGREFAKRPARRGQDGLTNGVPPRCVGCMSLERHRIFRAIFLGLGFPAAGAAMSCLQFARDRSIEPSWFANYQYSVFGGDNSLDLQQIERPSHTYDLTVCNHVIEHVPDDRAAFRELCRITRPTGFAFVSFPNPRRARKTIDWGYPDKKQLGHYRVYGMDVVNKIATEVPSHFILSVTAVDPVTQLRDVGFILTQSAEWRDRILTRSQAPILHVSPQT